MGKIILLFGKHTDDKIIDAKRAVDTALEKLPQGSKIFTIVEYGGPTYEYFEIRTLILQSEECLKVFFNSTTNCLQKIVGSFNKEEEPDLSDYGGSFFPVELPRYLSGKGIKLFLEEITSEDYKELVKNYHETQQQGHKDDIDFLVKKRDPPVVNQIKKIMEQDSNNSFVIVRGLHHKPLKEYLEEEGFEVES